MPLLAAATLNLHPRRISHAGLTMPCVTERASSTDCEGRPAPSAVRPSPWTARLGTLLFCEATEADFEVSKFFHNDPDVNQSMVRTYVDPDDLRRE